MTIQLGVVMDPIQSIQYKKDSTLAILWEAQDRGWKIHYFEQKDLFLYNNTVFGHARLLKVAKNAEQWYQFQGTQKIALADLDVILMRKDPPFDTEYLYTTYLLEHAENQGVLVVNKPQSLRDANEKLVTTWFPQCCPPTLVTQDKSLLHDFLKEQKDIICKPLDAMGGSSVFRLTYPDINASVVFEVLTKHETCYMMAQRFIPEINEGDKRVLLVNGEPIPYALARVPAPGELRGNLAAGAKGIAQPLTEKDRWICEQIGPILREKKLYFVGLDIIGDYLTEINVTSPTCIRELNEQCDLHIESQLLDIIEKLLRQS